MATRQTYYAESLAEVTTTSNTAADKVTLTFTPDANSSYIFLWSAAETISVATNATRRPQATLVNSTASTTLNDQSDTVRVTTDYRVRGGIATASFGATPASQTYKIQYATLGASADTTKIKDATLLAMQVGSNDQTLSVFDSTTFSTTFTTFVDVTDGGSNIASLTFTPPSSGDYLILASAETLCTTTASVAVKLQLLDSNTGTPYGSSRKTAQQVTGYYPWITGVKATLTGGTSQTYKVQAATVSGTMSVRRVRIIAIRLGDLPAAQYTESRTRQSYSVASSTYTDNLSLTFTAAALKHVVIAGLCLDDSSNSGANAANFGVNDSGSLLATRQETPQTVTSDIHAVWHIYQKTYSGASLTLKNQVSTPGTATVGASESFIAALQVEALASPVANIVRASQQAIVRASYW